ncbi:YggT family protein [Sedimentibacter sp. zth1]|uniref:YggT family protein n=1 Tax=Sedimentibacter sp. zth1 TaxID=2816908 RepID=UPI001A92186D|nr:YggT family protein [Sedimentibacter sp. zth1]QSX06881.1 YggT family protein [Sedimentibacter sp. zth1]
MISYTIKQGLVILIEIIEFAILVRILISYIPSLRFSKFSDIIYQITDPVLLPCKALLSRLGLGNGMLDFSPILAFLLLRVILSIVLTIF